MGIHGNHVPSIETDLEEENWRSITHMVYNVLESLPPESGKTHRLAHFLGRLTEILREKALLSKEELRDALSTTWLSGVDSSLAERK